MCVTHSRRKRSGYAPAKVCTATLTVQELSSFKRPASTSKDCSATTTERFSKHRGISIYCTSNTKKNRSARTVCTRVDRQRCARDPKMQQLQHPASEQRVVRGGGSLEQRVAQDRNRVRQGLQGLAEGREQVRLLFRVRGHAERGCECL